MSEPEIRINTNPSGSPTLGSVANAHRRKSFKHLLQEARGILIVAGIITIGGTYAMRHMAWREARDKIEAEFIRQRGPLGNGVVDQAKVDDDLRNAERRFYASAALAAVVGLVLIVLGMTIHKAPVPIAQSALPIYVGFEACLTALGGNTYPIVWMWKLAMIGSLAETIRAARAYEDELLKIRKESAAAAAAAK